MNPFVVALLMICLAALAGLAEVGALFAVFGRAWKGRPKYRFAAAMLLIVLVTAGVGAYLVLGRPGILKFAGGCCAFLAALLVIWSVTFTLFTYHTQRKWLLVMHSRVARLSTDELLSLAGNPADPAVGFATAELLKRGVAARPEKQSLFAMMVSDNSWERGKGFTLLSLFYPELSLPPGSSSLDPPEVWRERIRSWEQAE